MASNEDNASMEQGNQENNAVPPNFIIAPPLLPGECLLYDLPEDVDVMEPFEPITSFAVNESMGPLNGTQLKELFQKLDRRYRRTRRITTVAQAYTNDMAGLIDQLLRLRQRITQIDINEEYLADVLKERIKVMIKGIDKSQAISAIREIRLPNSAKKAFDRIESESPWNKEQLLNVIHTGNYSSIAATLQERVKLMEVMEDIIIFMKSFYEIKHLHFDHVCKKIRKAARDLMIESIN